MNYAKRFILSKTHMKAVMIAIALVFAISVSAIGYGLLSDEDASYADPITDYVQEDEGDGEDLYDCALDYEGKDYDTEYDLSYVYGYDEGYEYGYGCEYEYGYVCECEYECVNMGEEGFMHVLPQMDIMPFAFPTFPLHKPGPITLTRGETFADWTFSFQPVPGFDDEDAYLWILLFHCEVDRIYHPIVIGRLHYSSHTDISVFEGWHDVEGVPVDPRSYSNRWIIAVIGLEGAQSGLYYVFETGDRAFGYANYLWPRHVETFATFHFTLAPVDNIPPPATGGGGRGGGGGGGPTSTFVSLPTAYGAAEVSARVTWGRATIMLPERVVTELIAQAETEIVFNLSAIEGKSSVMMSRRALGRFANAGLEVRIMTDMGDIVMSPQIARQIVEWAPSSHFSFVFEDGRFIVVSGLERLEIF